MFCFKPHFGHHNTENISEVSTFESAITPSESSGYDSADIESLVDREKELATKVGLPVSAEHFPLRLCKLVFLFSLLHFHLSLRASDSRPVPTL